MLPSAWRPVNRTDLVRLGSAHDGGYIVAAASVDAAELLISMGLNDDWSFEADFRARRGAKVICYDHSVDSHFWKHYAIAPLIRLRTRGLRKYLQYRKFFSGDGAIHKLQMIGYDQLGAISLGTILRENPEGEVFLKVDIEGAEYRVFDDILAHQERITGIAIEVHDLDLHRTRFEKFLAGLTRFQIVSLHANNYSGVDKSGDPLVLEMALARDDLVAVDRSLPPPAHRPNSPTNPDLELRFDA